MDFFIVSNVKDFLEIAFWMCWWFFAWQGLSTWKKQIKWNVEYDTARKILNLVYKIRHWVSIIRNPFVSAFEMKYSWDRKWLSDLEIHQAWEREAYINRMDLLNESRQRILIDILEAEVLWWNKIKLLLYNLIQKTRKLDSALQDYFKSMQMKDFESSNYWKKRQEEVHELINSSTWFNVNIHPDDKFALELEIIINDIENYLKKYL